MGRRRCESRHDAKHRPRDAKSECDADEVTRLNKTTEALKCHVILAEVTQTVYVSNGIGIGSALAIVCSWQRNRSILWAILAGIFGWFT